MQDTRDFLHEINVKSKELYREHQVILSFPEFLDKVRAKPKRMIRNSSTYLLDTFDHFGTTETDDGQKRYKLFDLGTEQRQVPIIGNEKIQNEIYKQIKSFVTQGFCNKLIMLHGPNGSAKTSIIESIGHGMNVYSQTEQGAVYRFNWLFPTDKSSTPKSAGEASPIGFSKDYDPNSSVLDTYAYLPEQKIACKIMSEFKENPIFLIPMPLRERWLKAWIAESEGREPDDVELPDHILLSGLSKKNQQIYENLLAAYDGDLMKVFRHIQVERFHYSRQYREGIGTIEPQMSIDAAEKQLTIDRNLENLPRILHNIVFSEAIGPIVNANRGFLEFSDLLKRPLEAFKYLLSSVEKSSINLPSSTALLDIVFLATSNEKHLDAFKAQPDFASFKSRFELVTVPYQLRPSAEQRIYDKDIKVIAQTKPVLPHAVDLLSLWACLTRLKTPNSEYYPSKLRSLVSRIDPMTKISLYENNRPRGAFSDHDYAQLKDIATQLKEEHENIVVFEGRFGASPREIKTILHRASQNPNYTALTPMAIFDELDLLVKDRTVYDFLQIEPRNKYHDVLLFNQLIKEEFCRRFKNDINSSMVLVEDGQYDSLLEKYVDNVVAFVKKEKIYNKITSSYEAPSAAIMEQVEKIVGVSGTVERFREGLLGQIAAYRLNNPEGDIEIAVVFKELLDKIKHHYFLKKKDLVDDVQKAMLGHEFSSSAKADEVARTAEQAFELMAAKGYSREGTVDCLKFYLTQQKTTAAPKAS